MRKGFNSLLASGPHLVINQLVLMKKAIVIIFSLLIVGSLFAEQKASEHLTAANARSIHQLCQPLEAENQWRSIPWHSNIWQAREQAAKEGKPVYLWEMDGHPLGCV